MRRADRLFALVQLVRGRRLSTAAWLAGRLEVSLRTVYRDVADLQAQGVPIEGEAGVGYRLGRGFDLPPLMFTLDEARALAMATQMASQWLDPVLALAASDAMSRVMSVLPAAVRTEVERLPLAAPGSGLEPAVAQTLQSLREAIQQHSVLQLDYLDLRDQPSRRHVWPLGCFYWGKVWTLAAWCESREDFRSFRVDRIRAIAPAERRFSLQPGRTLSDMLRQVCAQER
ncbi:MAG: YafY family protein [Hydrogenophaga sp.]